MRKIELGLSNLMSLSVNASSGSEDENEEVEELEEDNALEMSDEEFEKMSEEDFADAKEDDDNEDSEDSDDDLGDDDQEEEDTEANDEEPADSADDAGSDQADEEDESEENQPSEEDLTANAKAYEAAYQELFGQPIKASGREVKLRDVTQVRNLVEMGVDYNKKMQHMRPHMQTLKTLEKQGILNDPEKLNLLLEAQQGKPEAIRKLLAEAELDLVDMADDESDASQYTPDNHIVSQDEVEIENALTAISKSPSYQETLDVMSNTFDTKSKEIISENPQYITALNADIESGLYKNVMEMVQYQRDVKAIPDNVSDIEAYIGTVQQMARQEQSGAQSQQQAQNKQQSTANPNSGTSRKRRVGMSGNRATSKKKEQKYDPMQIMEMSDDDFDKKFGGKLL